MRRSARDTDDAARKVTRRALFLGGCQAAVVAVLAARLRYMQVEQADQFRLLAEENRVSIRLVPPARGQIFDRNGVLIAGNEQNYRVTITREDAGDVEAVLHRLAEGIPLTEDDIERTLREVKRRSPFVPIIVAERLTWEQLSWVSVNAPSLPGVQPEVGLSRVYPLDQDFAHAVGYVGPVSESDLAQLESPDPVLQIPKFQIGKVGVERRMEDALRGAAGSRRIEVNAAGRVMRELDRREGDEGADVVLTLDVALQNYARIRLGGESASAVVMDVQSGDIVALVSVPSFDPNLFVRGISNTDFRALMDDADFRPLSNKAVSGAYPPGSTFKMVTALAALEAGVITPETTVRCPGHYDAGGRRFHCWKRGGHGAVNLNSSLAESCDVYYYDIAQRVGIDAIAAMSERLGLGVRHDLPMSAIAEGLNPNRHWKREKRGQEWRIGDTINASIGQGYVLASPIQLAVMSARLATGLAVEPRLVKAVDGVDVPVSAAAPLGLKPQNLRAVQQGMFAVTNTRSGTAYSSRSDDKATLIAGKTGTSQVRNITAAERARGVLRNDQLPWNRRDHALYVAYAPSDAPRYAVSVVVEHGGGGSGVAAPIARDILLFALHGGIPPETAYPAAQRNRIETQHRTMPLRDPGQLAGTSRTRA
ncbi:peptidoglycan glycosyltransferase [Gemmobacter megaterium]|uniref:Peptidoglycan glycosyltransferase n=1 Tax=Gemmobacter megaterium TaxID=1086013 RepID=A0A1N7MCN6_9RHOB|nr:penicillin-binding protein 2 [Gemmobacter megaterium]GGE07508.1 peptidoglycan glycosyltransferase [Gemmobacter megaterium]SIS83822.1 peptidoglycan glycosyltransferase [Gemmobacter megaterium]